MVDSDRHWIRFGEFDPYLKTVQTLDPYKLDSGLPTTSDFYFVSGERYLDDLFLQIDRRVAPGFKPRHGVDFGCSVGRIAVPLSRRCQMMTGVDIAPGSLLEAEKNAAQFGVGNARWVLSDDALSRVADPFDFFHSYNVLQHLAVERGLKIVRRAVELIMPGGVLAVHVPYADLASPARRTINWAQTYIPGVRHVANVARGRAPNYPHMLMNPYDLGAVYSILAARGCEEVHCKLVDQRRYPGAIVMARVPASGSPARSGSTTG